MTNPQGIACPRCGASTPLPDDLRSPTFACGFCHGELRTADFAGPAAVSADALLEHVRSAMANPGASNLRDVARSAPRFQDHSAGSRPAVCLRCHGPVEIPLDLHQRKFVCPGCAGEQFINEYISDTERLGVDMARQVAGNEAFQRLLAEGVACGRCGGRNAVPDDGSVQLACSFCGAAVLLAEHVDPGAIARRRLKHGVFAVRDEAMRAQAARGRRVNLNVGIVVTLLVVGFIVANLLVTRH